MILFRALHKRYVENWQEYEKGSSYKLGARWNEPETPVLYMSSNVQNAMLELANYCTSPNVANTLFVIGVFEVPTLRLKEVQPEEMNPLWAQFPFNVSTQQFGSKTLLDARYDGLIVPSSTINNALAMSEHNEVRKSIFANIVLNPKKESVSKMALLETFNPVYSNRMFNSN
ncbi:RES family NAD+ phosphorylase [Vibrio cholerae]|uniref:RES family NAD+ phosphorylase n=1 Tax=Vibrio cholerae TaxID=666 RepID=UPI003017AE95